MAYLEIVTSQGKQSGRISGDTRPQRFALSFFSLTWVYNSPPRSPEHKTERRHMAEAGSHKTAPSPEYGALLPSFPSQLKEKANLTLAVETLPLPPPFTFIPPGRMCWVAGWGETDVKEPASSTLQESLVEPRACSHFPAFDYNLQLCVGNPQSTKSALRSSSLGPGCRPGSGVPGRKENSIRDIPPHEEPVFLSLMAGLTNSELDHREEAVVSLAHLLSLSFSVPQGDSGGPLLCAGVAQGIVSYGQANAKPPAVFTRIAHYRPWIDEVLTEN
ncbi:mast cell protease 2-like [Moschus berezovskii]|uniref:mast cell protease 2-like n=1 Tax=Moschus berezovskii TaxID=68408 RepID=UPI0024438BAD|nr:mast cell protease 2-like [Moschus berezovskii]